jgi:hypothetical protein
LKWERKSWPAIPSIRASILRSSLRSWISTCRCSTRAEPAERAEMAPRVTVWTPKSVVCRIPSCGTKDSREAMDGSTTVVSAPVSRTKSNEPAWFDFSEITIRLLTRRKRSSDCAKRLWPAPQKAKHTSVILNAKPAYRVFFMGSPVSGRTLEAWVDRSTHGRQMFPERFPDGTLRFFG